MNIGLDECFPAPTANPGTVNVRILTDAFASNTVTTAKGAKQKLSFYLRDQANSGGYLMYAEAWGEAARKLFAAGLRGQCVRITKFKVQQIPAAVDNDLVVP